MGICSPLRWITGGARVFWVRFVSSLCVFNFEESEIQSRIDMDILIGMLGANIYANLYLSGQGRVPPDTTSRTISVQPSESIPANRVCNGIPNNTRRHAMQTVVLSSLTNIDRAIERTCLGQNNIINWTHSEMGCGFLVNYDDNHHSMLVHT